MKTTFLKDIKTTNKKKIPEPSPYTAVQTLAARLRHINAAQELTIVLKTPPRQTTKQGQPAVIFDMYDFVHTLAVNYNYTLVGKFSVTMQKMELIRKKIIQQT